VIGIEDLKPGDRFQDTFRIDGVLGHGWAGVAYLATEEAKGRQVVVKLINKRYSNAPDFPERFLREMQALRRLVHPNLAQIHTAGKTPDGRLYVVTEYLDGVSLRRLIEKVRRLDLVSSLYYGVQIAEAVGIAHAKGIRHRDIKPENIIIGAGGRLWVLDFGLGLSTVHAAHMAQKRYMGTPRYMSPEQIHGYHADARADVYAMGIVLYEMLAGRHPYPVVDEEEIDETSILAAHVAVTAVPLAEVVPDFPEPVWEIVAKSLAKDRELRYPSADALAADLRGLLRHGASLEHPLVQWMAREAARRKG
jgi:eukaryotic-like serine/threonine-protein kinase